MIDPKYFFIDYLIFETINYCFLHPEKSFYGKYIEEFSVRLRHSKYRLEIHEIDNRLDTLSDLEYIIKSVPLKKNNQPYHGYFYFWTYKGMYYYSCLKEYRKEKQLKKWNAQKEKENVHNS